MNLKLCTMVIALCLLILQINIYILFSKYWQPNLPSTHIDYSSKTETARPLPHNIFEFVLRLANSSLNMATNFQCSLIWNKKSNRFFDAPYTFINEIYYLKETYTFHKYIVLDGQWCSLECVHSWRDPFSPKFQRIVDFVFFIQNLKF